MRGLPVVHAVRVQPQHEFAIAPREAGTSGEIEKSLQFRLAIRFDFVLRNVSFSIMEKFAG